MLIWTRLNQSDRIHRIYENWKYGRLGKTHRPKRWCKKKDCFPLSWLMRTNSSHLAQFISVIISWQSILSLNTIEMTGEKNPYRKVWQNGAAFDNLWLLLKKKRTEMAPNQRAQCTYSFCSIFKVVSKRVILHLYYISCHFSIDKYTGGDRMESLKIWREKKESRRTRNTAGCLVKPS